MPVIAGFFYGCSILVLRKFCRGESTLALAWAVGIVFLSCGLVGAIALTLYPLSESLQSSMPFIAIGWPTLVVSMVIFAVLMSLLNLSGNIFITRAYQTADASLLAPLDFSYLLFAAVWGKVLFDQWPTKTAWVGIVLIIVSGLITAWRERQVHK